MYTKRGQLFIVSAPSGAGKTTLSNMLLKEYPNLSYSVSYTTRPPRTGEIDGIHYHFVDTERFRQMAQEGEFLEYAQVHGNLYGTSRNYIRNTLASCKDIILDIDPQGARQLKARLDQGVFIFIMPPSVEILRQRLHQRNDTEDTLELRLKNAVEEMACVPDYDYVIINRDINQAYGELASIYRAEKCRTSLIMNHNTPTKDK